MISSLLRPLRGICGSSGRPGRPAYETTDRFVFTFPLSRFLGFGSGKQGTLWEKLGNEWRRYERIDGSADYDCAVDEPFRNRGFNLSNSYPTYKWNGDSGYEKIGRASW